MWIQWLAVTVSTLIYALKCMHVCTMMFLHWSRKCDCSRSLRVALVFGHSAFRITAIQFGIDQLQGAPSDELTAFVFWYFCMEQSAPDGATMESLFVVSVCN